MWRCPPEWDPAPLPSNTQMLRHAASSLARQPGVDAQHAAGRRGGGGGPRACTTASWRAAASSRRRASSPRRGRRSTAPSPTASGSPSLSVPLEDVKLVGRVFEATVNDVILAVRLGWAAAAARGPRARRPTQPLVAMVPVSTRPDGRGRGAGQPDLGDAGLAGQRHRRPGARLDAISESARVAKEQEKLHRGRFLGDLAQIAAAGAGLPRGPCRGRDPALRQGAAAVQRHRLERAGPGRSRSSAPGAGWSACTRSGRWPRGSAST